MGKACSTNVKRDAYRIMEGKPEGRIRCRWVNNTEMYLR
jgi:hypothetical protein